MKDWFTVNDIVPAALLGALCVAYFDAAIGFAVFVIMAFSLRAARKLL